MMKIIIDNALAQNQNLVISGDFNLNRNDKKLIYVEERVPFILTSSMKDYRAGGKPRVVDYAFANVPLARIRYAEALLDLSDHNPILFEL